MTRIVVEEDEQVALDTAHLLEHDVVNPERRRQLVRSRRHNPTEAERRALTLVCQRVTAVVRELRNQAEQYIRTHPGAQQQGAFYVSLDRDPSLDGAPYRVVGEVEVE